MIGNKVRLNDFQPFNKKLNKGTKKTKNRKGESNLPVCQTQKVKNSNDENNQNR